MAAHILLHFRERAGHPFSLAPLLPADLCLTEYYVLAHDQPVPVMSGKRPQSPYRSLDIHYLTGRQKVAHAQFDLAAAAIEAGNGERQALWLYEPITEMLRRPEMPEGTRHVHLAFTNPAEGRDAEYNDWYSGEHLSHALLADGFVTAQRYKLVRDGGGDPSPYEYLTLYGLRTDDLRASEDDMHRFATGEKPGMPLTDAMGPVRATWVYSPMGAEAALEIR